MTTALFKLCGFASVSGLDLNEKLEFPAKAYLKYCQDKNIPCPISETEKTAVSTITRDPQKHKFLASKDFFTIDEFVRFYLDSPEDWEDDQTMALRSLLLDFVRSYKEKHEVLDEDSKYLWHYSLAGFESKNCFSEEKNDFFITKIHFPAIAFAKILHDKDIKLPVEWENRFSLQQKENSSIANNEIEKQKVVTVEAIAPDDMTVVKGLTVGQLRGLLDEKNEGSTFCPRLLAAIRVELELNKKRAQVEEPNNFTMLYGKNEKELRKTLIEDQCKKLKIFNCNDSDAQKRSGNRTITPQDVGPIERVLMHEREAKNGRH